MNAIEELGALFDGHTKRVMSGNQNVWLELGTINEDESLTVGSLSNAIPKGDYMVPLHLTIPEEKMKLKSEEVEVKTTTLSPSSVPAHKHGSDAHMHLVPLPEELRKLMPGDRVLVAWCGTEPVIIDIVISS